MNSVRSLTEDSCSQFWQEWQALGRSVFNIVTLFSPHSTASTSMPPSLRASAFRAGLPSPAASTATAPTRSRVSAAASQTCTGIAPPPVLRACAAKALAAPSKQPLAQAPTRSTASAGMPPPSAASTAIPLQVMIADLLPKLSNLSLCQQMRVTLIVNKTVDSVTKANLKREGMKLPFVRKTDLLHAYFCQTTIRCLKPFLQMVEDQGLTVRQYGVQYGLKEEVPLLIEDAEKIVSPVLKHLGYVKLAGDDVHYSRTTKTGTDEGLLTCFKGRTFLHLYGPSSPEAQALEWNQLWECLTTTPSGEETPCKRAAAESLCSLNPGKGDDSPAARTRSRMN